MNFNIGDISGSEDFRRLNPDLDGDWLDVPKPAPKRTGSKEKATLTAMILHVCPDIETEYKFHPKRKWRFDWALLRRMVAIEYEGGIYSQGRHTRGPGFRNDCEKYNAATEHGWRVFRYTCDMVDRADTFDQLKRILT